MNTDFVAVNSSAGDLKIGWAERLVIGALADLKVGCLRLELPDGRRRTFGQGEAAEPGGPLALIRVCRQSFFRRCLLYGDIGFAESYLDGDWETDDIAAVIRWFLANVEEAPTLSGSKRKSSALNLLRWANRIAHLVRPNSERTSRRNITEHYDLSNDFFATFLDAGMTYSSALWERPEATLAEAQEAKYERLCQQLRLEAGDEVLEIGCGWGSFARYAVANYGCRVTGLTLSPAQLEWARRKVKEDGLSDRIDLRLEDYRRHEGSYSKIVSIEMLEAVGHRYLPDFAQACQRLLRPQGLMALQFIVCPDSRYQEFRKGVDFIQKHIFPGSLLLSTTRLSDLLAKNGGFWLHDLRDLGLDYSRTLRVWRERFVEALDRVADQGFDQRFIRKWTYYLSYCEAAFAGRNISVVQAVYTRPNNPLIQESTAASLLKG
jgi:cyclopropane-fatty-acyl-phospholipid synthase